MREYKEHFVAFMDILGFKELITHETCETIYQVFDEIHNRSHANLNFNGVQIKAYADIYHRILSDSVIVFIETAIEDSFAALLDVCTRLQTSLANRENPILLRGGIAKGTLYYENDIIFGQGLTNAYLLESKLAKYPRIIFTGDTMEAGRQNAKYMFPYLENIFGEYSIDDDGLFFVDYFPAMHGQNLEKIKEYGDRLFSLCDRMLNSVTDSNLRDKYLWLKHKTEQSIEHMGQVKELYDKEQEEKREKEFLLYNERMKIYNGDSDFEVRKENT